MVFRNAAIKFWFGNGNRKIQKINGRKVNYNKTKEEILKFLDEYLYVDENAANSIYEYFKEQFFFSQIPTDKKIVIEYFSDKNIKYAFFHALYGRRVNDCLSRAVAFAIGRTEHKNVEVGINDNGFYIAYPKKINALKAFKIIKSEKLELVMNAAIDKTEILKRRFRHCAGRALMILRSYKGRTKRVGRQQVSSMILMSAVKRIDPNFSILKEAKREVLEDLMDIKNTKLILSRIEKKEIKIKEINLDLPSPFAFNLASQGITDVLKIEDRVEYLKRMHQMVLAKIGKNHFI